MVECIYQYDIGCKASESAYICIVKALTIFSATRKHLEAPRHSKQIDTSLNLETGWQIFISRNAPSCPPKSGTAIDAMKEEEQNLLKGDDIKLLSRTLEDIDVMKEGEKMKEGKKKNRIYWREGDDIKLLSRILEDIDVMKEGEKTKEGKKKNRIYWRETISSFWVEHWKI